MPTTPSALAFGGVRYIAPGTRHFYWVPTIANTASPTRAELVAGTDLTPSIAAADGWTVSSAFVDTPDFGSRTISKIPGAITFADSSLTFYESSVSTDVRALLTQDLVGYVTIMLEGDVTGQKMNVFKVQVASVAPMQSISDPAQIQVSFGIFSVNQAVTIPA
jgi:hypothetical protein